MSAFLLLLNDGHTIRHGARHDDHGGDRRLGGYHDHRDYRVIPTLRDELRRRHDRAYGVRHPPNRFRDDANHHGHLRAPSTNPCCRPTRPRGFPLHRICNLPSRSCHHENMHFLSRGRDRRDGSCPHAIRHRDGWRPSSRRDRHGHCDDRVRRDDCTCHGRHDNDDHALPAPSHDDRGDVRGGR